MQLADDTPQRLLVAAGQVFAEKGKDGATVRDIIKRAGTKNVAAVNYYFGDKDRLYEAALRHAFQCRFDQIPLPNWTAATPAADRLRDAIRMIVERMVVLQLPWQMQLLMRELSNPSPAGAGLVRDFIRPVYELLWSILRDTLPGGVTETKLHLIGFSIIGQCFYYKIARPVIELVVGAEESRGYDTELLVEHITDFTLAALGLKSDINKASGGR